jgi:NAD/NADP transhydrogenase alpha subunit
MGAGVAGLAAIGTARGLGAVIKVFDARSVVKAEVESLGAEFVEVNYQEEGSGVGGYAKEMSEGYKAAQRQAINDTLKEVRYIEEFLSFNQVLLFGCLLMR